MMDTPKQNELLDLFSYLTDEMGFRIVTDERFSQFDNASLVLSDDILDVRVLRDRGIVDAEVSPTWSSGQWLPLASLRQIILKRSPLEDVTIQGQAEFLRSYRSTISTLLSRPHFQETAERVLQYGRDRLEGRFPGSIQRE